MRSSRGVSALRYAVLTVLALLFLLPFYVLLRNGFSSERLMAAAQWRWLPDEVNGDNLRELFSNDSVRMARSMANSAVVAVVQTLATVVISALAGYGLARIDHRLSRLVLGLTVLTLMVPAAVTFIPSFIIVSQLRWVDTLQGIIVPVLFSGFTTFLFRQYFLNFPKELEEAARVDGLGYFGAFWRVVVPNSGAFFAAIAVITFIASWNAFLWPLVIGQDSSMWTVQVALSTFLTAQTINLHELFLAAAVSIVPLVLVFVFLQRYLVQGVAETGIKG